MKLIEVLKSQKATYVGNCANSFDEDGECTLRKLPWGDVTNFAQAEEDAETVSPATRADKVDVPKPVADEVKGHKLSYLVSSDVYMLYDHKTDIHYFFI